MNPRRFRSSTTVAVAVAALVVGLTAPAMAHEAKVVAHKISGSQLKNNSVTGKQVKESTLSTVPRATNATKLGGKPASAYAAATTATASGQIAIPAGGKHTFFTRYPLTWIGTCTKKSGTDALFTMSVKTQEPVVFTQTGQLGSVQAKGSTLEVDNGEVSGTILTVTNYAVAGADGAEYAGVFSAGINVEGKSCSMAVTAMGAR